MVHLFFPRGLLIDRCHQSVNDFTLNTARELRDVGMLPGSRCLGGPITVATVSGAWQGLCQAISTSSLIQETQPFLRGKRSYPWPADKEAGSGSSYGVA